MQPEAAMASSAVRVGICTERLREAQGSNLCLYRSLVLNSALRNMVAVTLCPSSKTIYKCLSTFLTVNLTLLL